MRTGLGYAVLSAATFGFSGTLARPLLDSGWSPGVVVMLRALIAGAVLAVPAVRALGGRWHLVRDHLGLIGAYGVIVVAFTQFGYYSAVARMDVAVALLVEYAAPVIVLGWLWIRYGQRPSRTTALGTVVAVGGLLLVLDLFSGARVSMAGMAWAVAAMVGCAFYFVLSARPSDLPPTVLVSFGLLCGSGVLLVLGVVGLVPMRMQTLPVHFRGLAVPFWVPLLGVAVIATAAAYVLGVMAGRRLGARLASFIALLEVVAAALVSWALLGQAPHGIQVIGGLGLLAGIVLVKVGEPDGLSDAEAVEDAVPVAA